MIINTITKKKRSDQDFNNENINYASDKHNLSSAIEELKKVNENFEIEDISPQELRLMNIAKLPFILNKNVVTEYASDNFFIFLCYLKEKIFNYFYDSIYPHFKDIHCEFVNIYMDLIHDCGDEINLPDYLVLKNKKHKDIYFQLELNINGNLSEYISDFTKNSHLNMFCYKKISKNKFIFLQKLKIKISKKQLNSNMELTNNSVNVAKYSIFNNIELKISNALQYKKYMLIILNCLIDFKFYPNINNNDSNTTYRERFLYNYHINYVSPNYKNFLEDHYVMNINNIFSNIIFFDLLNEEEKEKIYNKNFNELNCYIKLSNYLNAEQIRSCLYNADDFDDINISSIKVYPSKNNPFLYFSKFLPTDIQNYVEKNIILFSSEMFKDYMNYNNFIELSFPQVQSKAYDYYKDNLYYFPANIVYNTNKMKTINFKKEKITIIQLYIHRIEGFSIIINLCVIYKNKYIFVKYAVVSNILEHKEQYTFFNRIFKEHNNQLLSTVEKKRVINTQYVISKKNKGVYIKGIKGIMQI